MDGRMEVYKCVWKEQVLLGAAEQFIPAAVTDHLAALPFPKVVLQTCIDLSKVLVAFRDVVTVVAFEGPLVTWGTPGRHRGGTQEGAQQKQRRDHLHFLRSFLQQSFKEEWSTWHGYSHSTDLFPQFAFWLTFFFPVNFWRFEPECWRVFSPRR